MLFYNEKRGVAKMERTFCWKKIHPLSIIFIFSIICTGIFYEYYSCAFSVSIIIYFIVKFRQEKKLFFYWNITSVSIVVFVFSYLLSTLWAIDPGMAFMGWLKFLPILLFLIALMQDDVLKIQLLVWLPYITTVLTVISIIAMLIPGLRQEMTVAGRMAGFFQYPNTYALLILVSQLLLVGRKMKLWDIAVLGVLISGVLLTGSRTVFVLAIVSNVVLLLIHKNKKVRRYGIIGISVVMLAVVGYVFLVGGTTVFSRYLRFSLTESTFVGRILYFVDAIPTILKTPFGLGYMGYYYVQQSIQTGLYSVRYIHNDFLQILLDVGWLPCVLFLVALIKNIADKDNAFDKKVVLCVIILHSCFDFNLQFVSMFCLILLFVDYKKGSKKVVTKKNIVSYKYVAIGIGCVCLYCGIANLLFYQGEYEASLKLYPWNTQAQTQRLIELDDLDEAGELADAILERNEFVTLAYSVKAREAYQQGDFGNVILYKNELIKRAPFQYEEYEEYAEMLLNGIRLYKQNGDNYSADICKKELIDLSEKLELSEKKVSVLGKKIKDHPKTEFPQQIQIQIEKMEESQ